MPSAGGEAPSEGVAALVGGMTREEKVAQLVGLWVSPRPDGEAGPIRDEWSGQSGWEGSLEERLAHGLGQVSRPFGTGPVDPATGSGMLDRLQRRVVESSRLGIPAMAHEECLTGLMALGATVFPSPLNWGSTWDPDLVTEMADAIRAQMRSVGVHQGLAPVLDVVRDPRWGRVEECISEDPYLVGVIGTAYIVGLQGDDLRRGVAATTKHFAGYSFSEGGRNLAPAHVGPRELADVFLVPFEMAVRLGRVRSVMNAYHDNDGEPAAASRRLLTDVLRDRWGFDGVVVSDYFAVDWLHLLHGVASSKSEAAALALRAGIDLELPNPDCYTAPLLEALDEGTVEEDDLDRAVGRVLALKEELGLFEAPYVGEAGALADLDPPHHRALSRRVAEASLILLKNEGGLLPLPESVRSVAVIGPNGASRTAALGNYCFDNHVASHLEDPPEGVPVVTVAEGITELLGERARVEVVSGCQVLGDDRSGFPAAADAARRCDVAVVVVGDQAGHFGMGTSGEGTDTDQLGLPGVQAELVGTVAASGTPTVVVLVTGRPYALQDLVEQVPALVQAWFPGEEAGHAVADVLFGRVNPGGRLSVTFSRGAGQQPNFYNDKALGRVGYARSSTRPVFCFGHGLSYTTFDYSDLVIDPVEVATDAAFRVSCRVTNSGGRPGDEVVQLYLRDLVGQVTRPVQELKGFSRVSLVPGQSVRVSFSVSTDMVSFTGVDLERVVEPGMVQVMVGASCEDIRLRGEVRLVGGLRRVGDDRVLTTQVEVEPD